MGMTMLTLGLAHDEAEHGIKANCLWPRTLIATAAVQNLLGGDEAMRRARTPAIYADAAYELLASDRTGEALIDDEVLAGRDLSQLPGRSRAASSRSICSSTAGRSSIGGRAGRPRTGAVGGRLPDRLLP